MSSSKRPRNYRTTTSYYRKIKSLNSTALLSKTVLGTANSDPVRVNNFLRFINLKAEEVDMIIAQAVQLRISLVD